MKKISGLFTTTIFWILSPAFAQTPSVDEIVERANHVAYYSGQDGRAKVQMLIRDDQGRSRKRSFVILRKNTNTEADAEQKYYVYFTLPSDMERMVFMVWKHWDGDDDRWMYYPSLDLVKRIAGGDKRTSFVGSTFLYEDVSGRRLSADHHKLVETTDDTYVIENIPIDQEGVKFSRYVAYVDKQSFLPLKTEYYNGQGKIYRVYEVQKWAEQEGNPTVVISSMKDLDTGMETYLRYSEVEYDTGIDEDIFTERYLRKVPADLINF